MDAISRREFAALLGAVPLAPARPAKPSPLKGAPRANEDMIAFYKSDVPAGVGKADAKDISGALFVCYDIIASSTGRPEVEMQLGSGQRFPCIAGLMLRVPFRRLTFFNLSSVAREVHFWVGQQGVDYNFTHWQRPVRTIPRGWRDTIAPGGVEMFEGSYLGLRRRAFYIQTTGTSNLTLRGSPNTENWCQGLVHPGLPPLVLETDADIVVVNDSAANIETYVTEIFHVGP